VYASKTRKEKFSGPGANCQRNVTDLASSLVTSSRPDKSPVSAGEEYHVKNDDEVDESHKSQLKFEHEVYLLNYTIKQKKRKLGF